MASNLMNRRQYGKTLYLPSGIIKIGDKLAIADRGNNRVLIYNSVPLSDNSAADTVIGQPDLASNTSNYGGISSKSLNSPSGLGTDGTRLFIADTDNHRILIYNSLPSHNFAEADLVVGQPDMSSNSANRGGSPAANTVNTPNAVYSDGTRLFVGDDMNNRILIYNAIPSSNNAAADVVLGQPDMSSNAANNGGLSAQSMYQPSLVYTVGSRLYVSDIQNNRVLIYNTIPAVNFAAADAVVGQPDMMTRTANTGGTSNKSLSKPVGLFADTDRLIVLEQSNNRVMVYKNIDAKISAFIASGSRIEADVVIGQPDFASNSANQGGAVSASGLNTPSRIYSDGTKLFISDYLRNHRVLIYNSIPEINNAPADVVIGQPNMTSSSANQTAEAVSAVVLAAPRNVFVTGSKMIVCDSYNNRVLIYNSIPSSDNAAADVVIGQPDFTSNLANQGGGAGPNTMYRPSAAYSDGTRLLVVEALNHRVLVFDSIPTTNNASADLVIGQPDLISNSANQGGLIPAANTFYYPVGISSDGTRLFVSDQGNHRVLIFNSFPAANNASADVVIGQPDMSSNLPNQGGLPGPNTINYPTGVHTDGTRLYIGDWNHRVVIYNSIPTANNASADVVIGQSDFASNSANRGGSPGANTLSAPTGISVSGSKLFVTDLANNRVLVYNTVPTGNNASANIVIGQPDFTSNSINRGGTPSSNTLKNPSGIWSDLSRLCLADESNSRVLIYELSSGRPVISEVKMNDAGVVSGDIITPSPVIKAKLSAEGAVGGVFIDNLKITLGPSLYTYASFDATTDSYNPTTGIFTFKSKSILPTGVYDFRIEVSDYLGNWGTFEAAALTVKDRSGEVRMEGVPLNHPNPFSTATGATKITYTLTVDTNIMIYLFDVRGALVWKRSCQSGSMGGKAGYNEVEWDGKDDFGSMVGNGIYPFRVVAGARVLGRGKIAVLD